MSLRRTALLALAVTSALALAIPAAEAQGRRGRGGDTDGDGKISLQEFIAQRGRIFDRIDANHDGQITKDEVTAFQARMEAAAAGATIRSGKERGEGGERQLERMNELVAAGPLTRAQWDAMLTARFKRLDTAGTGYITRDQMRPRAMAADPAAPAAPAAPQPPKS